MSESEVNQIIITMIEVNFLSKIREQKNMINYILSKVKFIEEDKAAFIEKKNKNKRSGNK